MLQTMLTDNVRHTDGFPRGLLCILPILGPLLADHGGSRLTQSLGSDVLAGSNLQHQNTNQTLTLSLLQLFTAFGVKPS